MLEPGLSCTEKVAGSSGRPGSSFSHKLESQECFTRVCSENSQTPMDFRISQPFLLHLSTFLLPPEMAPDLQETFERSYLLTDGKKWILHLIIQPWCVNDGLESGVSNSYICSCSQIVCLSCFFFFYFNFFSEFPFEKSENKCIKYSKEVRRVQYL